MESAQSCEALMSHAGAHWTISPTVPSFFPLRQALKAVLGRKLLVLHQVCIHRRLRYSTIVKQASGYHSHHTCHLHLPHPKLSILCTAQRSVAALTPKCSPSPDNRSPLRHYLPVLPSMPLLPVYSLSPSSPICSGAQPCLSASQTPPGLVTVLC